MQRTLSTLSPLLLLFTTFAYGGVCVSPSPAAVVDYDIDLDSNSNEVATPTSLGINGLAVDENLFNIGFHINLGQGLIAHTYIDSAPGEAKVENTADLDTFSIALDCVLFGGKTFWLNLGIEEKVENITMGMQIFEQITYQATVTGVGPFVNFANYEFWRLEYSGNIPDESLSISSDYSVDLAGNDGTLFYGGLGSWSLNFSAGSDFDIENVDTNPVHFSGSYNHYGQPGTFVARPQSAAEELNFYPSDLGLRLRATWTDNGDSGVGKAYQFTDYSGVIEDEKFSGEFALTARCDENDIRPNLSGTIFANANLSELEIELLASGDETVLWSLVFAEVLTPNPFRYINAEVDLPEGVSFPGTFCF